MKKINRLQDKDWLYEQYITNNISALAISNLVGCSAVTVGDYIKKHNIQKRNILESRVCASSIVCLENKEWLYNEYIILNKSLKDIGDMLGVSISFVSKYIKLHKISKSYTSAFVKNKTSIELLSNKDWLYEQYIINKLTIKHIANMLCCSSSFITKYLKKYDIEIRLAKTYNSDINYDLLENAEWLHDRYINDDMSVMDISKIINCSDVTVISFLKKFNIVKADNLLNLKDKDWLYKKYIEHKHTTYSLADELNCCRTTISRWLNKHNIDITTNKPTSFLEHKVREFLDELNIQYIASDREQIKPLELDIFIPDKMIAIEINGVYWHSELYKSNDYHETKRKLCNEKNIRLIQLYEDDLNERFDIIKRFLLNALNINNEERIFARKCSINHKPNKDMVKRFMNLYHIQGYAANNKAIALEYNNETVAVMLFKGNVLTRYTTSKKVVGGFSKLLKASDIDEIITFVDLDTFTGDAYFKVGFEIDSYLKPGYKYVVNGKRIHKFNFRLKKFREDPNLLYEEGLTEKQLAQLNNIPRIYDSGKYRLKINLRK
jgi:predicted transcriptional regulator